MKFGLTAGLQTKVVSLAVADNFLNYRAHLVNLDWEYDEIEIKDKSICGANPVSFNKYKEIYKEIKTKKPNFSCRNKKDKELIRKMLKKTN
jgi:hypothetical protein